MKPFVKELKITTANTESFKQYLVEISKIPLLDEHEEHEYAVKAQDGDETARRILVESNLRFVVSVAKQSVDNNSKLEDLVNEGNIGLIIAAERFDPTRGFKFISYAVWWIRQRINEFKNENSRTIRLPNNVINQIGKVRKAISELEQGFDREPTIDEIAEHMDVTPAAVQKSLALEKNSTNSLDKTFDEDGFTLLDTIPMEGEGSDEIVKNSDKAYILKEMLGSLKPRDEMVIRLCYGLGEHKPLTLKEIGDMIGISREGVRLIRDRSLFKLKKLVRNKNIDLGDVFKTGEF